MPANAMSAVIKYDSAGEGMGSVLPISATMSQNLAFDATSGIATQSRSFDGTGAWTETAATSILNQSSGRWLMGLPRGQTLTSYANIAGDGGGKRRWHPDGASK